MLLSVGAYELRGPGALPLRKIGPTVSRGLALKYCGPTVRQWVQLFGETLRVHEVWPVVRKIGEVGSYCE